MRIKIISLSVMLTAAIVLSFYGCTKQQEDVDIVAKINNYSMTTEDLTDEMKYSAHSEDGKQDMDAILDLAIKKQILIQEAQKQGIDREKRFMQIIERYWEQTLIRELIEQKMEEISYITDEDKQAKVLDDWLQALYDDADITIDENVLLKVQQD